MKFFYFIAGLALTANANPIFEERAISTCQGPAYTILRALPIATSFCSSYLHIPTSTVAATTQTVFISTATLAASTLTSTVATTTTTVSTTTITGSPLNGRAAPVIPLGLLSFTASELSSACSCLSVTPAKITVTATASATSTSSVTSTTLVTATSDAVATATIHNPTGCDNQAIYTAAAGEVFEEYCDCDSGGADLESFVGTDLPSCIEACQTYNEDPTNNDGCVAVALAYKDGTDSPPGCYLKYSYHPCFPNSYYVEFAEIVS